MERIDQPLDLIVTDLSLRGRVKGWRIANSMLAGKPRHRRLGSSARGRSPLHALSAASPHLPNP